MEFVVEGGELRFVLEADDFHEIVRTSAILVDGAVVSTDGAQEGLELPHEIEELPSASLADGIGDGEEHTGIGELGNDERTTRRRRDGLPNHLLNRRHR